MTNERKENHMSNTVNQTPVTDLIFKCPKCGGTELAVGIKTYEKAVVDSDGFVDLLGKEIVDAEGGEDFRCWDCEYQLQDNNGPIFGGEAAAEWLIANCEQD